MGLVKGSQSSGVSTHKFVEPQPTRVMFKAAGTTGTVLMFAAASVRSKSPLFWTMAKSPISAGGRRRREKAEVRNVFNVTNEFEQFSLYLHLYLRFPARRCCAFR